MLIPGYALQCTLFYISGGRHKYVQYSMCAAVHTPIDDDSITMVPTIDVGLIDNNVGVPAGWLVRANCPDPVRIDQE